MAANAQRANFARPTRQWWIRQRSIRRCCLIVSGACALGVSTLFAGGCALLEAPAPEPTPTPPPTPAPDVFDPKDFITANPPAIELGSFRVFRVASGELVYLQSVAAPQTAPAAPPGKGAAPAASPKPAVGVPERAPVRIAGILAPAPGQPGGAEVMRAIQNWTLGQNVTVQQDSKYLNDPEDHRKVQIFFNGRRKDNPKTLDKNEDNTATVYLLNRMLVRGGLAVVDINEPSSFDFKGWLNDEEYARQQKLGLWGKGIVLGRRPPLPPKKVLKQTVIDKTTRPVTPPVPRVIR